MNAGVAAYGADSSTPKVLRGRAEVDEEMSSILSEELEIERLSAQFDLASNITNFAKGRRQWSYNFGNAFCTEGGLIAATALFASNTSNRHAIHFQTVTKNGIQTVQAKYVTLTPAIDPNSVNGTITPQIVGQCISITGGSFELMTTLGVVIHRDHLGLAPRTLDSEVIDHLASIDRKLKIAAAYCSENPSASIELRILKDLRDRALSDYFVARLVERRWASWNNSQNVTGVIRNTIGTVGNSINELGRHEARRRLNGDGSILNFISASIILVRPYFCEAWAKYKTRNLDHKLKNLMGDVEPRNDGILAERILQLKASSRSEVHSNYFDKREQIYNNYSYDRAEIFEQYDRRLSVLSMRSTVRGSIYAPTKQTQSMINIVTQFRPRNNTVENNRYSAIANLTYTSGQIFNISELVRQRLADEVRHRNLEKAKILPTKLLAKRIELLSQDIGSIKP